MGIRDPRRWVAAGLLLAAGAAGAAPRTSYGPAVQRDYDLAITGLRLAEGVERGRVTVPTSIGLYLSFANLGRATVEGASARGVVRIVLYLTRDRRERPAGPFRPLRRGEFEPGKPLRGGIIGLTFPMPPGFHRRNKGHAVALPAAIEPGRWWLCAYIDADDVVPERNERNNIRCRALRVMHADGGAAAGASRGAPQRTEPRHAERRPHERDAGREIARRVLEDLLEDARKEAPQRRRERRRRERPAEGNEAPPASACTLDGPLPNLQAVGVKAEPELRRGRRYRVSAVVRNRGRGTAPAYDGECGLRLHVVLSRSERVTLPAAGGYGDGTYVVLDAASERPIAPGKRFAARPRDSFLDLSGVPRGRYWLCVVADPDNGVPESDETDNVRCEYRVTVR